MTVPPVAFRPIDPFAAAPGGRYADEAVVVRRKRAGEACPEGLIFRSEQFTIAREGHRLLLVHDVPEQQVDNDIAALIVRELFEPGWVSGADTFERLLTGVVLTCRAQPLDAWELFYRNTLCRLAELGSSAPSGVVIGHGCLSDIAPVYRRGLERVREVGARSVLDLGCCFGFFPLQIARSGVPAVYASDISPGTCQLVERVSGRIRPSLQVLACDAESVPMDAGSVDVVTSLHLLEHVEERQGDRILAEAVRLARRRIVVAVPMELVPDPAYGHVRTLTPQTLARCAQRVAPDWRFRVEEHHGAWLVMDRI